MTALNYQKTKIACYLEFITQAISANFAPLLFLKFHHDYLISLGNIAGIATCFFFTQLLINRTGIFAGDFSESSCRNSVQCYFICNGKRTD